MAHNLYILILIVALADPIVKCTTYSSNPSKNRVKDIIYHSVTTTEGFHPCFRRANGTHQFGCQSSPGGNIGVVHLITSEQESQDLNWVIKDGSHYPYTGKK